MNDIYKARKFEIIPEENSVPIGNITEKEKFLIAKHILSGLALLYIVTLISYLIHPSNGIILVDICKTTFPPLATMILVYYFRDTQN